MVSSGTDNCIKMWVFDSPDGTARLLRSREGHRAPPRAIRYYGNTTLATMGEGAGEIQYLLMSVEGRRLWFLCEGDKAQVYLVLLFCACTVAIRDGNYSL